MWTSVIFALLSLLAIKNAVAQDTSLSLSYVPEYKFIPIFEQDLGLVVTFTAPSSVSSSDRLPVSVTAILDRSGSMSGDKIDLLKRSTEFLVNRLESSDYLGVVSYSSNVRTDLSLTRIGSTTKSSFEEVIESIEASGSTNLSGGLFKGVDQQVDADVSGNIVKSCILFTDGLANVGVTDIGEVTSTLESKLTGSRPPTVYALGFGGDHDASYLQAIAETGGGSYVFVPDEKAIASAIGEVLGGLLTITAQDISLEFKPLNGARIVSIKGGDVSNDLSKTTFPDLFAEERRDVLVDMKIPVLNDALESQAVLSVTLRYFNTITEKTEIKRSTVVIDRSVDVVETTPAPLVETTRLRFEVADNIKTALKQKQSGDTEGAEETLDNTIAMIDASSVSGKDEATALKSDVETTKAEIESEDFNDADANRIAAGSASVGKQRATTSSGFSSSNPTTAQFTVAAEADSFVGGGVGP